MSMTLSKEEEREREEKAAECCVDDTEQKKTEKRRRQNVGSMTLSKRRQPSEPVWPSGKALGW